MPAKTKRDPNQDDTQPEKKQKLNSGEAATKSTDDDLSNLKKRMEASVAAISPSSLPTWTFEEVEKIVKPFENLEPAEFDKDMAVLRFELLESLQMPQGKDEKQQEYLDRISDKISDFQKNYAETKDNDDGDSEVTFKRFLQFVSPLIDAGDYTQWKQDDLDRFIKFWAGRNAVDAVGNLDSAIIVEDFLNGEWSRFLHNHPTLKAIMCPFFVFADWSEIGAEDESDESGQDTTGGDDSAKEGEGDGAGQTTTGGDSNTTTTGTASNKAQQSGSNIHDRWTAALESYPGEELSMKPPKEVEGTDFCFSFAGNTQGRRMAAHFITYMRQRVPGARFWVTHSPGVVRV